MSKNSIGSHLSNNPIHKTKIIKFSPIHNLIDTSFILPNQLLMYKRLRNKMKRKESSKSIFKEQKIIRPSTLELKKVKSNDKIDKGIIWYNKNRIKIPKLIFPKVRSNLIQSYSTDRKGYSHIKDKFKFDNKYFYPERNEEISFVNKKEKKVNDIFKINSEIRNSGLKLFQSKKRDIDSLLEELGILNYCEDRVIKKMMVGSLDKKNIINRNKAKILKNQTNIFKSNKFSKRLDYFDRTKNKFEFNNKIYISSSMILNQNNIIDKFNNKNADYTFKNIRRNKLKNLNNQIKTISEDLNNIDNQIQNCNYNLKESFNNELKNELSNFKQ
jgi:hypothetical protein